MSKGKALVDWRIVGAAAAVMALFVGVTTLRNEAAMGGAPKAAGNPSAVGTIVSQDDRVSERTAAEPGLMRLRVTRRDRAYTGPFDIEVLYGGTGESKLGHRSMHQAVTPDQEGRCWLAVEHGKPIVSVKGETADGGFGSVDTEGRGLALTLDTEHALALIDGTIALRGVVRMDSIGIEIGG